MHLIIVLTLASFSCNDLQIAVQEANAYYFPFLFSFKENEYLYKCFLLPQGIQLKYCFKFFENFTISSFSGLTSFDHVFLENKSHFLIPSVSSNVWGASLTLQPFYCAQSGSVLIMGRRVMFLFQQTAQLDSASARSCLVFCGQWLWFKFQLTFSQSFILVSGKHGNICFRGQIKICINSCAELDTPLPEFSQNRIFLCEVHTVSFPYF